MIPTSLSVRNFMCYRAGVDLDLRGIRIACLSGDNGAGKSALLDCITWALWGKARVNSDRELIALNTTEMEVTFGFELNNQNFRVTRRRSRGGAGPLALDIQTMDGDRWRSISGTTARETQRAIDQLLKMDYDTFINSAFILQGRADEFTTKTPALRKQTLGEILNLSDYDHFEEVARQQLRDRERQLREIDAEIARIDDRLGELPERLGEVKLLSTELVQMADQMELAVNKATVLRQQVHILEIVARQREQLAADIAELDRDISRLTENRQQTAKRIETQQAMLNRREEIESRHVELSHLRAEQERIGLVLAERQRITQERQELDSRVQQIKHEIDSQLRSVRDRLEIERRIADTQPKIEAEAQKLKTDIGGLADVARSIDELRATRSNLEAKRAELTSENERLRTDMNDLKRKIELIERATAICPVCRGELGPTEQRRLAVEYQTEGTALGNRFRSNRTALEQIKTDLEANTKALEKQETQRSKLEGLRRQEVSIAERLATCERAANEVTALIERERELIERLADDALASAERAAIAALDHQLVELAYDADAHRQMRRRIADLGDVERELSALLSASATVESGRQQLEMIDAALANRAATRDLKASQEAELASQIHGFDKTRDEFEVAEIELQRLERLRGELQERFGAAQQRVRDLEVAKEERIERGRQRQQIAADVTTFEELAVAFGKRGIQAMIIENVVPELQDEANRILDKMPGNTMRVEFRTQRQTLRGERTIETLDIVISDEVGSRNYELYSGGEAFRINFAIRVALSMLLAKRAGARLQTLVIDEGFGTQDSRGRDGLIEAIRAVESDFRMILVITHIAELKDVFPTRIDVVKGVDGSLVSIN